MSADRHLLLGLLALQTGLIQPAHLVAAFRVWTGDKSRSLADHLAAMGHLGAAQGTLTKQLPDFLGPGVRLSWDPGEDRESGASSGRDRIVAAGAGRDSSTPGLGLASRRFGW